MIFISILTGDPACPCADIFKYVLSILKTIQEIELAHCDLDDITDKLFRSLTPNICLRINL